MDDDQDEASGLLHGHPKPKKSEIMKYVQKRKYTEDELQEKSRRLMGHVTASYRESMKENTSRIIAAKLKVLGSKGGKANVKAKKHKSTLSHKVHTEDSSESEEDTPRQKRMWKLTIPLKPETDTSLAMNDQLLDQAKTEFAVYYLEQTGVPTTQEAIQTVRERMKINPDNVQLRTLSRGYLENSICIEPSGIRDTATVSKARATQMLKKKRANMLIRSGQTPQPTRRSLSVTPPSFSPSPSLSLSSSPSPSLSASRYSQSPLLQSHRDGMMTPIPLTPSQSLLIPRHMHGRDSFEELQPVAVVGQREGRAHQSGPPPRSSPLIISTVSGDEMATSENNTSNERGRLEMRNSASSFLHSLRSHSSSAKLTTRAEAAAKKLPPIDVTSAMRPYFTPDISASNSTRRSSSESSRHSRLVRTPTTSNLSVGQQTTSFALPKTFTGQKLTRTNSETFVLNILQQAAMLSEKLSKGIVSKASTATKEWHHKKPVVSHYLYQRAVTRLDDHWEYKKEKELEKQHAKELAIEKQKEEEQKEKEEKEKERMRRTRLPFFTEPEKEDTTKQSKETSSDEAEPVGKHTSRSPSPQSPASLPPLHKTVSPPTSPKSSTKPSKPSAEHSSAAVPTYARPLSRVNLLTQSERLSTRQYKLPLSSQPEFVKELAEKRTHSHFDTSKEDDPFTAAADDGPKSLTSSPGPSRPTSASVNKSTPSHTIRLVESLKKRLKGETENEDTSDVLGATISSKEGNGVSPRGTRNLSPRGKNKSLLSHRSASPTMPSTSSPKQSGLSASSPSAKGLFRPSSMMTFASDANASMSQLSNKMQKNAKVPATPKEIAMSYYGHLLTEANMIGQKSIERIWKLFGHPGEREAERVLLAKEVENSLSGEGNNKQEEGPDTALLSLMSPHDDASDRKKLKRKRRKRKRSNNSYGANEEDGQKEKRKEFPGDNMSEGNDDDDDDYDDDDSTSSSSSDDDQDSDTTTDGKTSVASTLLTSNSTLDLAKKKDTNTGSIYYDPDMVLASSKTPAEFLRFKHNVPRATTPVGFDWNAIQQLYVYPFCLGPQRQDIIRLLQFKKKRDSDRNAAESEIIEKGRTMQRMEALMHRSSASSSSLAMGNETDPFGFCSFEGEAEKCDERDAADVTGMSSAFEPLPTTDPTSPLFWEHQLSVATLSTSPSIPLSKRPILREKTLISSSGVPFTAVEVVKEEEEEEEFEKGGRGDESHKDELSFDSKANKGIENQSTSDGAAKRKSKVRKTLNYEELRVLVPDPTPEEISVYIKGFVAAFPFDRITHRLHRIYVATAIHLAHHPQFNRAIRMMVRLCYLLFIMPLFFPDTDTALSLTGDNEMSKSIFLPQAPPSPTLQHRESFQYTKENSSATQQRYIRIDSRDGKREDHLSPIVIPSPSSGLGTGTLQHTPSFQRKLRLTIPESPIARSSFLALQSPHGAFTTRSSFSCTGTLLTSRLAEAKTLDQRYHFCYLSNREKQFFIDHLSPAMEKHLIRVVHTIHLISLPEEDDGSGEHDQAISSTANVLISPLPLISPYAPPTSYFPPFSPSRSQIPMTPSTPHTTISVSARSARNAAPAFFTSGINHKAIIAPFGHALLQQTFISFVHSYSPFIHEISCFQDAGLLFLAPFLVIALRSIVHKILTDTYGEDVDTETEGEWQNALTLCDQFISTTVDPSGSLSRMSCLESSQEGIAAAEHEKPRQQHNPKELFFAVSPFIRSFMAQSDSSGSRYLLSQSSAALHASFNDIAATVPVKKQTNTASSTPISHQKTPSSIALQSSARSMSTSSASALSYHTAGTASSGTLNSSLASSRNLPSVPNQPPSILDPNAVLSVFSEDARSMLFSLSCAICKTRPPQPPDGRFVRASNTMQKKKLVLRQTHERGGAKNQTPSDALNTQAEDKKGSEDAQTEWTYTVLKKKCDAVIATINAMWDVLKANTMEDSTCITEDNLAAIVLLREENLRKEKAEQKEKEALEQLKRREEGRRQRMEDRRISRWMQHSVPVTSLHSSKALSPVNSASPSPSATSRMSNEKCLSEFVARLSGNTPSSPDHSTTNNQPKNGNKRERGLTLPSIPSQNPISALSRSQTVNAAASFATLPSSPGIPSPFGAHSPASAAPSPSETNTSSDNLSSPIQDDATGKYLQSDLKWEEQKLKMSSGKLKQWTESKDFVHSSTGQPLLLPTYSSSLEASSHFPLPSSSSFSSSSSATASLPSLNTAQSHPHATPQAISSKFRADAALKPRQEKETEEEKMIHLGLVPFPEH